MIKKIGFGTRSDGDMTVNVGGVLVTAHALHFTFQVWNSKDLVGIDRGSELNQQLIDAGAKHCAERDAISFHKTWYEELK